MLADDLQSLEGSSLSVLLAGWGEIGWYSHKDPACPDQAGMRGLLKKGYMLPKKHQQGSFVHFTDTYPQLVSWHQGCSWLWPPWPRLPQWWWWWVDPCPQLLPPLHHHRPHAAPSLPPCLWRGSSPQCHQGHHPWMAEWGPRIKVCTLHNIKQLLIVA